MRILHTSDWHLGQRFHNFSRMEEQADFLSWLCEKVEKEDVDVLVVAGDIFDTSNPSNEAKSLYYSFLARVVKLSPQPQVIIIAGNHDSGSLIEVPSDFLEVENVHVRGMIQRSRGEEIDYSQFAIPMQGRDGVQATCLAIPFLRPYDCPCTEETIDGPRAFFHELGQYYKDPPHPILCTGHLYALGDSSTLSPNNTTQHYSNTIGSLERIGVDDFPAHFSYVALGHIHSQQRLSRDNGPEIWYSGSPYATSFGKPNAKHGVLLVDIDPEGQATVARREYSSKVRLHVLEGRKGDILQAIGTIPNGKVNGFAPLYAIRCEVDEPSPDLSSIFADSAKGKYMRLGPIRAVLKPLAPSGGSQRPLERPLCVENTNPMEIANAVWQKEFHCEMDEPIKRLLAEIISSL